MNARRVLLPIATVVVALACASAQGQSDRPAREPGQTFKECRHCPEMVVLQIGRAHV